MEEIESLLRVTGHKIDPSRYHDANCVAIKYTWPPHASTASLNINANKILNGPQFSSAEGESLSVDYPRK